ncbi:MAG TPA: cytochrome c oxidase subunit II [Thiotrichales bacterium]|nr:cytochrome c oxidase subunit II [Thiotrichales bacterium]
MFDRIKARACGLGGLAVGALATLPAWAGYERIPGEVDTARGWDELWHEVMVDITIIGIIFAAVTFWFLFRYRRRSPEEEGRQPRLSPMAAIGWAIIPAFAFMADDFFLAAKGWSLWNDYRTVPEDRLEIQLESAMWTWDYTYPNGVRTFNELRVPAGKPILLRMTSRDTIHSHWIPDFRVKEDSMPGRTTYLWFQPKEVGEHVVTCAEYCGHLHSRMTGKLIVMAPEEFDQWYNEAATRIQTASSEQKGGA